MQITKQAIKKLTSTSVLKLALALGCSEQWAKKIVKANKSNGPLTTYMALQVIRQETGLSDTEILKGEPVEEPQVN